MKEIQFNEIITCIERFRNTLTNQARFYNNYMAMFEIVLLFVRSSRQNDWHLHLSSLNKFVKYFFAHDQLNYARLTPVYIATMLELKKYDQSSWEYLSNNFSINKSAVPFTAIGSDHALEQDNRKMKVTGGIIGLTQNQSALNRYCLIAPILNSLSDEFVKLYNVNDNTKKSHYQLHGTHLKRLIENTNKLLETMATFDVNFKATNFLHNVVSKAVISDEAAKGITNNGKEGQQIYMEFISKRFHGEVSIWASIKKCNLSTFKTELTKVLNLNIDGKLIQMKEERSLFSRFLIISRKRPDQNWI